MNVLVKPPLKLKRRRLSSRQACNQQCQLGQTGESRAARFLVERGYVILERNIRLRNTELDLIALDRQHDEIVFVEVKTRSSEKFGDPSTAVNWHKVNKMRWVAEYYMRQHDLGQDYRFDILAVLPGTIHHYQNITWDL